MYKITEVNGVKTYNMSAGKTLPQFLQHAKKTHKSLKYDDQFKRRIQLIQDFSFDIATNQVQISKDQRYIIATGIYGPQLKIYDTAQLSLKCLRGLDSEVVKFCILSEDYSKIALAQADRTIEFHAQYGSHYKTRIPHYPRDLVYNPIAANLCISASASEVYRVSLQEGKFLIPFHTDSIINSLDFNQRLNVLVCGGDQVQIWDFRQRQKVCKMKTSAVVSKVKCDRSGLLIGVGEGSLLNIYDVRFDRKLYSIRSSYNQPINGIHFMQNEEKNIIFSNKKQIKICKRNGQFFTSVQPSQTIINSFTAVENSGFILAALQDPKVGCYFIPQLGSAPKWVPYIQNITQELQQQQKKMVFDQYKFVSKQEIYDLGCQGLINTKMLKEHMHGYLMHLKLYNKMRSKMQGSNYVQMRQQQIDKKVNQQLPKRIQQKEDVSQSDNRFANMLKSNPNFRVDKYSDDYLVRHPHMKKQLLKEKQQEKQRLEKELRVKRKKDQKEQIRHQIKKTKRIVKD